MKTKDPWGKPTFVIYTDFNFFLRCKIQNTSSPLESLMMTFFGLAFDIKQWQVSIFVRYTGLLHSLNIFKTQSSKTPSWIDSGISENEKLHFLFSASEILTDTFFFHKKKKKKKEKLFSNTSLDSGHNLRTCWD